MPTSGDSPRPLRIAALIKQVPRTENARLGPDGRLVRAGLELEMSAFCRRAVSKGVELAAETGGRCTVFTLGPDPAEDCLREALAGGADEGVLISDPAFAGSDTLATARALAEALRREGPFDLVLVGRNSVDSDTGQVGPEVAEFLDLPFVGAARELDLEDTGLRVRSECDDGWIRLEVSLPAVVATAERLCRPVTADPEERAKVAADRIRRLAAHDLGSGPWGEAGSPTRVGPVRSVESSRRKLRLEGSVAEQVRRAVAWIGERQGPDHAEQAAGDAVPPRRPGTGPVVGILLEPGRERVARELGGAAACLARDIGGTVTALAVEPVGAETAGAWGADALVMIEGAETEEDVAPAVVEWAREAKPWALLAPSSAWGRQVASRASVRLEAGLTGDAIALEVADGRLVAWKPAFGGTLVAAITANSEIQMATVRPGALPLLAPRRAGDVVVVDTLRATPRRRVRVTERHRDDNPDALGAARAVIGVGTGVPPEEYDKLAPLLKTLGAELGTTRKVTDKGWLPHSRQVGLTGQSIAPALYVAIGISGKLTHTVGIRSAGTVLAINADADALIFDAADLGIVADWREVVPLLTDAFAASARDVANRGMRRVAGGS